MFCVGSQHARAAFTASTADRCVSAGTVPAATTSQEPATAPRAGPEPGAPWVRDPTSLKRGVREELWAHHGILLLKYAANVFVNNHLRNDILRVLFWDVCMWVWFEGGGGYC